MTTTEGWWQWQKYRLVVIAPTCYYYQSALLRDLASDPRIDLKVYFCSEEGKTGEDVSILHGIPGKWGLEDNLLHGFEYEFLRNYSPMRSYLRRFGLINPSIWSKLKNDRPDVVVLLAWNNPTFWLALVACGVYKIPFLYMTDANLEVELAKGRIQTWLKGAVLGNTLFKSAAGFLCSGSANQRLFRYWGVPENKLVDFAYSWGYEYFLDLADSMSGKKNEIRQEYGIPLDAKIVLYCGRLSDEKNLFELIDAYERVSHKDKTLIFVGDGPLNKKLKDYVAERKIESTYFFGFQDRTKIPKFYVLADMLVLSSKRETWGIVVNEAMCFGLPAIVSDRVGAGEDLIRHNENGFVFDH